MTQNQEKIENNFHGKRVMYRGFALLDHSLLLIVISCADPGSPINGKNVNAKNKYYYGDTLKFACNDHYTLEGNRQIKCEETKDWSGALPYCRGNNIYIILSLISFSGFFLFLVRTCFFLLLLFFSFMFSFFSINWQVFPKCD